VRQVHEPLNERVGRGAPPTCRSCREPRIGGRTAGRWSRRWFVRTANTGLARQRPKRLLPLHGDDVHRLGRRVGAAHEAAARVVRAERLVARDLIDRHEKELRIDRYCSSGPGGQGVNTTYSAVRLTHLPTGLVVQCQDEKSQHKNKAKALRVLRSRLLEIARREQHDSIALDRRTQIGSGDRSEKIRTYNFPQSRVTDHRINVTVHQIESFLDGNLDPLIEPLASHHQAEKLKAETALEASSKPSSSAPTPAKSPGAS